MKTAAKPTKDLLAFAIALAVAKRVHSPNLGCYAAECDSPSVGFIVYSAAKLAAEGVQVPAFVSEHLSLRYGTGHYCERHLTQFASKGQVVRDAHA